MTKWFFCSEYIHSHAAFMPLWIMPSCPIHASYPLLPLWLFLSQPLWIIFYRGLSGLLFIAASPGYFLLRPLWVTFYLGLFGLLWPALNKPPTCKSHASPPSCRRNLTSASETSFLGLAPACDWLWIAWTRWERLSKVWEAGGEDSLREETRTRRCWGLARGRRRWRRTESQQSFTLFNILCLSCSSSISFFSSFCSSAWRVCGAVTIQNVYVCVCLQIDNCQGCLNLTIICTRN